MPDSNSRNGHSSINILMKLYDRNESEDSFKINENAFTHEHLKFQPTILLLCAKEIFTKDKVPRMQFQNKFFGFFPKKS